MIHTVTPMITGKEQVTQDFLDDLRAGKPRLLSISFEHSDVSKQAEALTEQRHLSQDDAAIVDMRAKAYAALKEAVLSGYGKSLQRLLADPRVSHVNSDFRCDGLSRLRQPVEVIRKSR